MPGFIERVVRRFNATSVTPNQAQRLLHHEGVQPNITLEDDAYAHEVVVRIAPANYPKYKLKRLEKSVKYAIQRYGEEIVSQLNGGDINSKGQITEKSLIAISKKNNDII